jgi:hypothetical protein
MLYLLTTKNRRYLEIVWRFYKHKLRMEKKIEHHAVMHDCVVMLNILTFSLS